MNDTFQWKRFGFLLRKTVLEKPVLVVGGIGLLLTLTFITYLVAKVLGGFGTAQNLTFIWGLPLGSALMASAILGNFSTNAQGISYIMLPASGFEKWLCAVLISMIIYPLLFLVFFHSIDLAFIRVFHEGLDKSSPFYRQRYDSVYALDVGGILAKRVYMNAYLLTSISLLGSLYFNKVPFVKIAIAISIVVLTIIGLNLLVANLLFGSVLEAGPFNSVIVPVGKEEGMIQLPEGQEMFVGMAVGLVLPSILCVLSLVRMREKEF